MTCDCKADGFCARYAREMSGRLREICRGDVLTPEKCAAYRSHWQAEASGRLPPGRQLRRLLAELEIVGEDNCGCAMKATQMDVWGIDGCKEHRTEIIDWLREAAATKGWLARMAAGVGAGWLVDEAIRRAEQQPPARSAESQ